jgi:hypothetical protein
MGLETLGSSGSNCANSDSTGTVVQATRDPARPPPAAITHVLGLTAAQNPDTRMIADRG